MSVAGCLVRDNAWIDANVGLNAVCEFIRSRLEVHEGSALKTQGEVNAWFAGFAACSGRDVPDEMVDRALLTYPPSRRGFADRDELKAALVAALGE